MRIDELLNEVDSLEDEIKILRVALKKIANLDTFCFSSFTEKSCFSVAYFALGGKAKDGKWLDKVEDL